MMKTAAVLLSILILVVGTYFGVRAGLHASGSDIIFSHNNHAEMDCADCHSGIEQSTSAEDRNLPAMDVCSDCHDVDDDNECGTCHRNVDDPQASPHPPREIIFGHASHIGRGTECASCHAGVAASDSTAPEHMPEMRQCFECHDGARAGDECALCHTDRVSLADIHPLKWRNQHGAKAALDRDWCAQCHREESYCLDCHRGDNLTGNIHDLNYLYTHGLDAKIKRFDCTRCHDNQTFCVACHDNEYRIPYLHSSISWLNSHGMAARRDPENCAACHDTADPTCARSGCHNDFDGVIGTNPRFHNASASLFRTKGPWHNDDGYYCFSCHLNTHQGGLGFCGYCHGDE